MSKKQKNREEIIYPTIGLDKKQIKQTTRDNEKEINILKDCQKFCKAYGNKDFTTFNIYELKNICNEGNGLLNTYFITINQEKNNATFIMQLEYIIMNATYTLNLKQMENTRKSNIELRKKLKKTMHRATRIEKDIDSKTKEIKHVKNDIKTIITTIISVILAISIIPTAIAGIEKISPNYILPFLSSVILFGVIMITFVYSIYQEKLKPSTWIILVISILICLAFWFSSLKMQENQGNVFDYIDNRIENVIKQEINE